VCCIAVARQRYKIVQLIFQKRDGSVLVTVPYGPKCDGLVSAATMPVHGTQMNLRPGGKVTSHLVKYSHHPDGEAHFSQDGKVRTEVRRRAVPLDEAGGHLFTVHVAGYDTFETPTATEATAAPSARRTLLTFDLGATAPTGAKIVGRVYRTESLRAGGHNPPIAPGPVPTVDGTGTWRPAFLVRPPVGWPGDHRIVMLTADEWPASDLSGDRQMLFVGGFDPGDIARDLNKPLNVLAMSYPIESPDELRRELGTINRF